MSVLVAKASTSSAHTGAVKQKGITSSILFFGWPLQGGSLTLPEKQKLLYTAQITSTHTHTHMTHPLVPKSHSVSFFCTHTTDLHPAGEVRFVDSLFGAVL